MLRNYLIFITLLSLGALASCEGPKDKKTGLPVDTPTTGSIRIMADEGYKPIIETSIDVFDSIYRQAKITPIYCSEGEAVNAILKDSIQVIIITRKLAAEELKYFQQRGFTPPMTPIAHDAVAFVVHLGNPDSIFTVEQIRGILTGQITQWNQVNPKSKTGDIRLVFDNPLSGTLSYVRDSIIAGSPLAPRATALQTNAEVIAYVSKNKNALGIIAANWISDTDDKGVQQFRREVNIADIAKAPGAEGFGPYQAYLATGDYPFKRTVYIINAQARKGLGLGFASFLAGDQGQRIVLKDGLFPVQAPTRLVKTSRK
jgi:phosphate transport system substrate-binding protein